MKFGKIHYALTTALVKYGAGQDVTEMRREDGGDWTGWWPLPKKQSAAEPPGYGSAAEQPDGQQVMWRRAMSGRGSLPLELQPWFRPALSPVGVVGTMRFRHHPSRRS
jgi:hypothetical protein